MVVLDQIHDGVILDGVGIQKDSPEMKKLKGRTVKNGSTDRSRLITFNDGDYYVGAKTLEKGRTDISTRDVRYAEKYKGLSGWFEQLIQTIEKRNEFNNRRLLK